MYGFDAWILSFSWCGSEVGQSSFRGAERSTTEPKPAGMHIRLGTASLRSAHPFPGKQNAPKSYKKALISKKSRLFWWGRVDSNHRRHSQQIYSLSPLATREHPRVVAASSGSSRFRPRPKARSLRCGSSSNRTRFAGLRFDVEEFNCIESPSAIRGAGGRT